MIVANGGIETEMFWDSMDVSASLYRDRGWL